jgi:hypothetical protein
MKTFAFLPWLLAVLVAGALLPSGYAQSENPGAISGSVFNDADKDAKNDDEDTASEGQTVKLYRILPDGSRQLVGTVKTDAKGNYSFGSLPLGTYTVVFEFTTGVSVESAKPIVLTPQAPSYVQGSVPVLPQNYQQIYGPLAATPSPGTGLGSPVLEVLNLRNPANVTGEEVSRFQP